MDRTNIHRQNTPDKFVNRDNSLGKSSQNITFRAANSSIISSNEKKSSGNKKKAFFEKHKESIGADTVKSVERKEKQRSESREASRSRLYNQETIASILKRNPELGYEGAKKKQNALPPRRPKKKIVKPPTPEPPKEDPPEEPLA